MARNKNTGNDPDIGDDIEPMWVSPDNAQDDWDDDFSAGGTSAEGDDDFSAPAIEQRQSSSGRTSADEGFDDFDDFSGDFSAEAGEEAYDDIDGADEVPAAGKASRKAGFSAIQSGGNKNVMTYAVMGVVGLVVIYMGYNMVFGGAKSKQPAPPPVNVVKKDPPKPQPVAGLTPVDLQQTPDPLAPVATAAEMPAKNTPPLPVAQPIGMAPAPNGAAPGGDVSADLARLATSAPAATEGTAPAKAPDVPLPTGMAGDTIPMIMNNGMPTLPVGADAAALAGASEAKSKDSLSDNQVAEIGDKLLAEFRNDMDRFKTDMSKSVKETIQDDMAILRVQVEGLNRRVDTMEQKGPIKPLEETIKPTVVVPKEQPVDTAQTIAGDMTSAQSEKTLPNPAVSGDADPAAVSATSDKTKIEPTKVMAKPMMADGDNQGKSAAVANSGDDKDIKPIEPIKIKKSAKKSVDGDVHKSPAKKKMATKSDDDTVKDLRSGLPLNGGKREKATDPTPFQKMAKTTSAQMYALRGVSAGTAWVSAANSGNIMTVSRGDFLPGMGRITEIRRGFSGWEVVTEKGLLRQ